MSNNKCKTLKRDSCKNDSSCAWIGTPTKKCYQSWSNGNKGSGTRTDAIKSVGVHGQTVRDIGEELPNFKAFKKDIHKMVRDNWKNQKLSYRVTYSKQDTTQNDVDMFTYGDVLYDRDIFTIEKDVGGPNCPGMTDQATLNNVFTDFNTLHMFSNRATRARIIYLVVECVNATFEEIYKMSPNLTPENLNVMFKGGVTMRFIVQDMTRDFVSSIEDYVQELVKKIVKISDFDFEIVSSPKVNSRTLNKVHLIIYILLGMIRNYMDHNKTVFFDLFKYNTETQHNKIRSVGKKLQKVIDNTDADNYFHAGRVDAIEYMGPCVGNDVVSINGTVDKSKYTYIHKGKKEKPTCRSDFALIADRDKVMKKKVADGSMSIMSAGKLLERYDVPKHYIDLFNNTRASGSRLYCTHNPEISAVTEGEVLHFQLNRIKYNYTVYIKTAYGYHKYDAPGEVIDISSAFADDRKKAKYIVNISENKNLRNYTFLNNNLGYISYSIYGHIADINSIIFDETAFKPWLDAKYGKRLYRVVILYLFLYFSMPSPSYGDKLDIVKQFLDLVTKLGSNGTSRLPKLNVRDKVFQSLYDYVYKVVNNNVGHPDLPKFIAELTHILKSMYKAFYAQQQLTLDQQFTQNDLNENSLDIQNPNVY